MSHVVAYRCRPLVLLRYLADPCPVCCVLRLQALERGSKSEEPSMRFLRLTLSLICCLFLGLTGVVWWQNMAVVDYAVRQAYSLHYLAHRMYYLQVCAPNVIASESMCATAV